MVCRRGPRSAASINRCGGADWPPPTRVLCSDDTGVIPEFSPLPTALTPRRLLTNLDPGGILMLRKMLCGAAMLAFAAYAHAATDYPTGFTKCAKEGETCTFSGTRSVAYGKAGTFVFATLTGPLTCAAS